MEAITSHPCRKFPYTGLKQWKIGQRIKCYILILIMQDLQVFFNGITKVHTSRCIDLILVNMIRNAVIIHMHRINFFKNFGDSSIFAHFIMCLRHLDILFSIVNIFKWVSCHLIRTLASLLESSLLTVSILTILNNNIKTRFSLFVYFN